MSFEAYLPAHKVGYIHGQLRKLYVTPLLSYKRNNKHIVNIITRVFEYN